MTRLILLLVTITHGGHWIGGHTETITLTWPLESGLPASTVAWECKVGSLSLANGTAEMPDALHPAKIKITAPMARAQTPLRFIYRVTSKADNTTLSSGEAPIHVYPPEIFSDLSTEYAGKHIALLDPDVSLRKLIEKVGPPVDTIPNIARIAMNRPDLLIVGPDQWDPSPFGQPALEPLARGGTQVVVFRQSNIDRLAGYRMTRREPARTFVWNVDHPLLDALDADSLNAWVTQSPAIAVRLPINEPAVPIGYWKPESAADLQAPIDALLVSKAVGSGRIVLCQLPAGNWEDDPRSQILLHNLLAYAMTGPMTPTEPARPPARRTNLVQIPLSQGRNITISAGAEP